MSPEQADAAISVVMGSEGYRRAVDFLRADHERFVGEIVRLTQIAAPPFGEAARGQAYLAMLREHGLREPCMDAAGNVMGVRPGLEAGPVVAIAAHLDTVFPAGTDVTVRRQGTRLMAPGVGDDTRGLAVLLAWLRALDAAGVRLRRDLLVVGDVGEEGMGDLRGMRHLFGLPATGGVTTGDGTTGTAETGAAGAAAGAWAGRIGAFLTVDGPEMEQIAVAGIGSKRLRVTLRGPGGHSWGAFGAVNPMFALGWVLTELGRTPVAASPRTTYCASIVSGGTSINAIPGSVCLEVDLRSEAAGELEALERRFLALVERGVAGENVARSTAHGAITAAIEVIGERPAGRTAADEPLVRLATAAVAAHGFVPEHEASSTDANIAMSLGIPAIKIGSGGTGGRAHSLEEWIDVEPETSLRGLAAGLATVMAVAGLG